MSSVDYTKGAAAAVADCKRGTLEDCSLFAQTAHGRGYRDQWHHMTKPCNQHLYPTALEVWNQAGKARVLRLQTAANGETPCTR